jgi:hypothetical protein
MDKYHVTYNNKYKDAFKVDTGGTVVKFMRSPKGMYYYHVPYEYLKGNSKNLERDSRNLDRNSRNSEGNNKGGVKLTSMVAKNRSNYSMQQYEHAKEARILYHNIGIPMVENLKVIIKMNMIHNCPITVEGIIIAENT